MDVGGQTINTAAAIGRMFLTMVAGFAELERNLNFCRKVFQVEHFLQARAGGQQSAGRDTITGTAT